MNQPEAAAKATLRCLFGEEESDDDYDNEHERDERSLLSSHVNDKRGYIPSSYHDSCTTNTTGHTGGYPSERDEPEETRKRKSCFRHQENAVPLYNICANNEKSNTGLINDKDDWDQKIGILDGLLTRDECDELIAVHASEAHAGYIEHLEVTRVSDLVLGGNENSENIGLSLSLPLLRARYKVWEAVEEFYPEASLELFPEYTALSAWHSRAFLRMHHDSNKEYLLDRHYSALLYLNDPSDDQDCCYGDSEQPKQKHHPSNYHRSGFSGGDLVFEVPTFANNAKSKKKTATTSTTTSKCKRIRPKAGRLVCFPSSSDYVHGVEEITRGSRYALTMWLTKHQFAMESLQSLQQIFYSHPRFHAERCNFEKNAMMSSPLCLQQPWETPQQAMALRLRILERAGLPKPFRPVFYANHETTKKDHFHSKTITQQELFHLIAHCWWKKGLPLGDLVTSATAGQVGPEELEAQGPTKNRISNHQTKETVNAWTLKGGDEFWAIFSSWKEDYLPRRWKGLASAMNRWMNYECGLITSVREDEME